MDVPSRVAIEGLVRNAVQAFAMGFQARHEGEVNNPAGVLNKKTHNVFIAILGDEIRYYSALARSLDSSLGNMLEGLAIEIAKLFYDVRRHVEGTLTIDQTRAIAELLEQYRVRTQTPSSSDYQQLRSLGSSASHTVRHESDYYLIDSETNHHYLIELKAGGDLDNKKARSEKQALLEQYAILANALPADAPLSLHFATAYNLFGEGKRWKQSRVLQYFAEDELMIGRDFWNFVCKSPDGYTWVLDAYRENADLIRSALDSIKNTYLTHADHEEAA